MAENRTFSRRGAASAAGAGSGEMGVLCRFVTHCSELFQMLPGALVNWPYTIFVIMPTNRRLMNTPAGGATAETRSMIGRWGILHAGRSALGLTATLIFLWAER